MLSESDSADLVTRRQAKVSLAIIEGIKKGGLTEDEWLVLYTVDLPDSHRGNIDRDTAKALQWVTDYRLYRYPQKLRQLLNLLQPCFNKTIQDYTRKGLLTLFSGGEVNVQSTLRNPVTLQKSLKETRQ